MQFKNDSTLKSAKIEKELNDYKATMQQVNINQEPKQKASGYGIVSLPKNAANGQISCVVKGETLISYIDKTKLPTEDIVLHRTNRRTYSIARPFKMIPGQIYTIFINVKNVSSEGIFRLNYKAYRSDVAWILNKGINKRVITAGSDTTLNYLYFYILENAGENETAILDPTILVLEGDWTNKPTPPFFRGTKSTLCAFRIRTKDDADNVISEAYVIAKDPTTGEILEARSVPNGTKDEFNVVEGKHTRKISDIVSISDTMYASLDTTLFTNVDIVKTVAFSDAYAGTTGKDSVTRLYDKNGVELTEVAQTDIDNTASIGKYYWHTDKTLWIIVAKGAYADIAAARTALGTMTLIYQLAEPVEIPVQVSGTLLSYPSGTVYVENVVADAGLYSDGITVLHQDLPIKSIEKISKIDYETGLETILDASKAVIASDKLSFTHPDLKDGDIVFFEYEYDVESTEGETEVEYYDSRYVIKDSITDKFYKWHITIADGVPSIELVEV
jgi:hypothetical protein